MIILKVKEVAQAKGVSMRKLSIRGGMTYRTVLNVWRNPKHDVSMVTLDKIATVLGVRICDLYDRVPDDLQNIQNAQNVQQAQQIPDDAEEDE